MLDNAVGRSAERNASFYREDDADEIIPSNWFRKKSLRN
jgi:hypothetical protein